MPENQLLHEVAITAIILKDNKFLIMRRSKNKKRFPGKWTVPGGKLESNDYTSLPKDTEHYWYNVMERVLKREVMEEAGIEIKNIEYLTSLARVHEDGAPSLVISCTADFDKGEITLQEEECDKFEWVSLEEAKNHDLIDGIYDEFIMVDNKKKGIKTEWKKF